MYGLANLIGVSQYSHLSIFSKTTLSSQGYLKRLPKLSKSRTMVRNEAYGDCPKVLEISMESSQHDIAYCICMRLKYELRLSYCMMFF